MKNKFQLFLGLTLIFIVSACSTPTLIPENNSAVIFNKKNGEINIIQGEQVYKKKSTEIVTLYDLSEQKVDLSIDALFEDARICNIDLTVTYIVIEEKVKELHEQFGENYEDKFLIPEIRSDVRIYIGKLKPEDLDESIIEKLIFDALMADNEKYNYVSINSLVISKLDM
jgi:SPFH domain / Band 7 family